MAAKDLNRGDFNKQELDDMTTCCICTEVYNDPKALPCIHTFCMKCIQETGLKTNKGPGDEMPCPICRRLFKIPTDGLPGLPKNFFIERLIQMANVSDSSQALRPLCDACLKDEREETGKEIPEADKFCVDCKHKLCEECCSEHRKFKLTKDHKLIPINEHEGGYNVMTDMVGLPSVCQLHEQKVLDVYCADCKTVVCAICFIDEHRNHEGSHVNKYVDGFRKQIESNAEAINECRSKTETKKANLLKVKEDIHKTVENLECDLETRKDELKQLTDKHSTSLLQGLYMIRQSKQKEIQMETNDIDAYLSILETYNSYCKKIMAKGSASDICRSFSDLSVRAVELKQQCQLIIEGEIQSFTFRFRKSELEQFLEESCDNLIGEFEEEGNVESKKRTKQVLSAEEINEIDFLRKENKTLEDNVKKLKQELETTKAGKLDPDLVLTIRTKAAEEEKKPISGLTILDKELFVVSGNSSEVEVYDSMKFSFSRRWNLNELIDPRDLVSCKKNKCLYIFDCKGHQKQKEILRVDPNGKLIKSWSTGSYNAYGLSVTDESKVILVADELHKLSEYSPDGQLIREINLSDAGIRYPKHAVKLLDGLFVVSHGFAPGDLHRVSIVDADGKLKKSFGGKRGSTVGELNSPFHLSVDGNGFVMVVDRENIRVLLLDSNLKLRREILSKEKQGLRGPWRILRDESNGRLFVVDNEWNSKKGVGNGRLLIFDFK